MKRYLRLLMVLFLVFISTPTFAGTNYGCEGSYTMKIGERVTLRRTIGHLPSNWTRVNWFVGYSGKSVKIISQDYDYCTIEAEAVCSNISVYCQMYYNGDLSTLYYSITVNSNGKLTVSASPEGGSVLPGEKVTLSTNYSGATIYYTLNGTTPTTNSTVYSSSGITINSSCTLKALAVKSGYTDSNIFTANYTVSYTFTEKTKEGIDMKFKITDAISKIAEVSSIDKNISGSVTIPSEAKGYKVTRIGNEAFNSCSALTNVSIPNSVTSIGRFSFNRCSDIKSLVFPNSIQCIEYGAFENCLNLTSIDIPSSVTSIETLAFYNCKNLQEVFIPNSVTRLGGSAFWGCTSLKCVTLPTSLNRIESQTFYACLALEEIRGGKNVEYIGSSAYAGTHWLKNLPDGMNFLGKVLFNYHGEIPANTTVSIPAGCTQVYDDAFADKEGLVGINIPAGVVDIAEGAFRNCPNLQTITVDASNSVYDSRNNCNAVVKKATNTLTHGCSNTTIPTNVTSIGSYAFYGNYTKDEIVIPNQIDSIASYAFRNNSNVKSILIGKGLRKMGSNVFNQLPHLKEIAVSTSNPYYDSRDNCNAIIEKATNTLVVGCSETTIPNTVKSIGSYAYYGNGDEYFTSLVIPNSVEEIKSYAFDSLPYLREVSIGTNVKTFGNSIFYLCNSLEAIESLNGFPDDIDEKVFDIGSEDFSIYDNVTLYVPVGCRNNYRLATGWSNFKNIVEGSLLVGVDDVLTPLPQEEVIYSPTGVRLSAPQRGVNIVNGKKLLVK